ncbi:type II secretion system GspH family protein [Methylomonas sp. SURF-2]|uniref:Type II secretion system GspH family protein n=1 Tax=Methylomonas subterranea TaxID=2952225 RepID=A0ABT1TDF2_9GAMM|nr:type II secretion system protein [Methylomonas sp. SURF-2]MCQ8103306.1 type II secretion system GspH family protein [Methylomonas sp. SURF-2]
MKMKQLKLQARQAGFTLLELLVVITLIAALAVGALIAYDGVGDKAQAAAAADANVKIDNAIRQYKAVTNSYPNQWDSLVSSQGASLISALPFQLTNNSGNAPLKVAPWAIPVAAKANIARSLANAGINEIQYWKVADAAQNSPGIIPNLAHNESFNRLNAEELEHWDYENAAMDDDLDFIAVVPSGFGNPGTVDQCQANGGAIPTTAAFGGFNAGVNYIQNQLTDALSDSRCYLVVALGFGSDAAASTQKSSVAIGKAPSFGKTDTTNPDNNVDPNRHYSRYIGLFLVGDETRGTRDGNITDNEYLPKAKLLTIIAPDGTIADQNLATAVQN